MEAFNTGFSCTGIHTCVPPHTIPHLWHIQCLVHDEGRVGLLDLAEDKDAPAGREWTTEVANIRAKNYNVCEEDLALIS